MPTNIGKIDDDIIVGKYKKDKIDNIKKLRKQANRLTSMANKRLIRLESNKLTESPAYKSLVGEDGKKPRFSTRNKSYNELQQEVAKLNKFINSTTSTVRGANKVLKDIAKNTGIKYRNLTDLKQKSKQFFELSSKVEQYLRVVDDMGSAIGYQKIWESVNQYVKDVKTGFDGANFDIDKAIIDITNAIKEYEQKYYFTSNDNAVTGWFELDKD